MLTHPCAKSLSRSLNKEGIEIKGLLARKHKTSPRRKRTRKDKS